MRFRFSQLPFVAAICGLLLVVPAGSSPAGQLSELEQVEIQSVIQRQLRAFLQDDSGLAFAIASATIQRMFGNPAIFMKMVQTGYPQVYRHRQVQFDELTEVEGKLVQLVWLTGMDGLRVLALYSMIKDTEGVWRINGCRIARRPGKTV